MGAPPGEIAAELDAPSGPRHRSPRRRSRLRPGWLGRGPAVALVIHVVAAFALMPVSGHPYDLAALTGTSGAWLRWGVPLFYHWKFGADLSVLAVGAQSLAYVLGHLGMSGAAALTAAWKLPLVLADLLVGVILVDLGKQLGCRRPGLVPVLWLLSPVPLWVSAGHGQLESLTVLAVVLSLDLVLRRHPLLAGVVMGLGVGVEYLPALVALVVAFWLAVSVIERRSVYLFAAGGAGALALCFGPSLATGLGRTSLLGGLSFTANVASHPGHAQAASAGSSLWAVLDLSPGPSWLLLALSGAAAGTVGLALKARRADSAGRKRLGILAAGGLLLCVTVLDPGTLPQFSVLVLAGLCLIGLCVELSPVVIILGPSLQLASGLFFVYGGNFQSFWYDMWAATGASGWSFPQSSYLASLTGRLGPAVVAIGLLLACAQGRGVDVPARLQAAIARAAIAAGVLGIAFLAAWSSQPAFWQGVGSQGPSTLADFSLITQSQPGTLTTTPAGAQVTFSSAEVLAARDSSVQPSLRLSVAAAPFFARTIANTAEFTRNRVQTLTIPGWKREKSQVNSLWISALFGRSAWRARSRELSGVPVLMLRGTPVSSSAATWVSPDWAVVTYNVPAAMVSPGGQLKLGLRERIGSNGAIRWNGSAHVRWAVVSLHSGTATATIDGNRWRGPVTLPVPAPSLWGQHVEQASVDVGLKPRNSVGVTRVSVGDQNATVIGGSYRWPSSGLLDYSIRAPLLPVLGVADAVALIGGGLALGCWVARSSRPRGPAGPARAA